MTVDIGGRPINVYPNWVDPEFFKTMGIPLLRGRNLLPNEPNAVIVSESLAQNNGPASTPWVNRCGATEVIKTSS